MQFKPIGYLYKKVAEKPDWLKAKQVSGIYSLSNCISDSFSDYSNSKPSVTLSCSPCRATALSAAPLRVTNDLKMELHQLLAT